MKKFRIFVFLTVFIVLAFHLVTCGDPPVREEVDDNPQHYLKVNHYVRALRKELFQSGIITAGFLPSKIEKEQTVEYLYWYACALFSDPEYAISTTIHFPTAETLFDEIDSLKKLEGFVKTTYEDYIIIGEKDLFMQLEGFFEPPVLDGSRYPMEYAIVSMKDQTITYSEVYIWESQIVHDSIGSQLSLIYDRTKYQTEPPDVVSLHTPSVQGVG